MFDHLVHFSVPLIVTTDLLVQGHQLLETYFVRHLAEVYESKSTDSVQLILVSLHSKFKLAGDYIIMHFLRKIKSQLISRFH